MAWQQWVFIAFALFAVSVSVSAVGKPRKPLEPSAAVGVVLTWTALVVLVVSL